MKKRTGITVIILMISIPMVLFAAGIVKVKKSSSTPKTGQVTFNHMIHQKNGVVKCIICHHTGKAGQSCSLEECHFNNKNGGYDTIHNKCLGCHRTKQGKAPLKCNECHK